MENPHWPCRGAEKREKLKRNTKWHLAGCDCGRRPGSNTRAYKPCSINETGNALDFQHAAEPLTNGEIVPAACLASPFVTVFWGDALVCATARQAVARDSSGRRAGVVESQDPRLNRHCAAQHPPFSCMVGCATEQPALSQIARNADCVSHCWLTSDWPTVDIVLPSGRPGVRRQTKQHSPCRMAGKCIASRPYCCPNARQANAAPHPCRPISRPPRMQCARQTDRGTDRDASLAPTQPSRVMHRP